MFHSPASKKGHYARRDSFAHSPFKGFKSPGSYINLKNHEESYLEEKEQEENLNRRYIGKYFEQREDYTVGEMFSELDYPQAHHRRESIAEATGRTQAPEQQYNRYVEDSAYKNTGSKLASLQTTYVETMMLRPGVQEVSRF